jgi:archaeosine-15-forming tRNA-guanine transglycosylase
MQEITDSIKKPNLRVMGIEEGEQVQAKGIHNIFNKIITENFPNLEIRKPPGHETTLIKIELPHDILSLKQQEQRLEKEY